jgi:hypothetical protein
VGINFELPKNRRFLNFVPNCTNAELPKNLTARRFGICARGHKIQTPPEPLAAWRLARGDVPKRP